MYYFNKAIILILFGCLPLQGCSHPNENVKVMNSSKNSPSPLLQAVDKRDADLVARILSTKPNLEIKDSKGRTALMIATYNEDNRIAELLISAGSNVNAQDEMLNSPFLYAGASGYSPILKMCLANGADFKIYNRYGGSALIPAAEKGHLEVVKVLTATPGYPIDHINNLGWTALLEAIILSKEGETQVAIVKMLVEAGSDVGIADKDGVTPLQHAKNRSMDEIVKILSKAGVRK
ncbi:ankyrin repeat domain-containing protein [Hymenobacter lapidiphilus]|uniref:ankyrin repeat domain-containing protein n=1 Tax=Hymenobacter sp. CCM 8763 TaxID=2303334 RepID=UPI000E34FD93|nr:ankyrin repeat domain-containing protein [Hymenobacter sp. CCM 8763]RFP65510.1 ankyrin repeat domain-containing protein [Hymenobacter sp. CCM 8763]